MAEVCGAWDWRQVPLGLASHVPPRHECVGRGDSVLEPVPIHCGVLQGSPLSPTLFNIYINPTLKAMEEEAKKQYREGRAMWGVPLPRVQRRGVVGVANPRPTAPLAMADPGAVLREDDYLPCLFLRMMGY